MIKIFTKISRITQKIYCVKLKPFFIKKYNVKCPCCGWQGANFLREDPISHFSPFLLKLGIHNNCGRNRRSARYPNCNAKERHRLYYLYLLNIIPKNKRLRVLHFAPEEILTNLFVSYEKIEYLSVDVDPKKAMRKEDITNLSFNKNSFDIIFCSHVLEHVEDDIEAMRELYRVLKPKGFAILQVPIQNKKKETYEDPSVKLPREREKIFGQVDHVRIYGRDYVNRLKKAGFQANVKSPTDSFSNREIKRFGLKKEFIYQCTK
jgi:SAM-dependent methyltransferase